MTDAEAEPILRAAAAVALKEQKTTGVNQIMGGELFADPFLSQLPRFLTGIEVVGPNGSTAASDAVRFYRRVRELNAPRGLGYAAAFRRERELDPQLAKASCPGPYMLLSFLLLADPSALRALPEASDIVRREVAALVQSGAREVQLDEPTAVSAVCLLNHDPAEVAAILAKAFRSGLNVTRTIHFCFSGLSASPMRPSECTQKIIQLIRHLEGKVDKVHLECIDPDVAKLLNQLPPSIQLVAGIADVSRDPEPVETLVSRGREVLRAVRAERVWLAPTCGLYAASRERAIGILTNLVAAAKRLP